MGSGAWGGVPRPQSRDSHAQGNPGVLLPRNIFISRCSGTACWGKSRILWPSSGDTASGFRHFLVSHLGAQRERGLGILQTQLVACEQTWRQTHFLGDVPHCPRVGSCPWKGMHVHEGLPGMGHGGRRALAGHVTLCVCPQGTRERLLTLSEYF